jgi:hypothetical protein
LKNLSSLEIKTILSALEDLLEMKILIRQIVPHYSLDEQSNEKFLSILSTLQDKFQPIFQKYLIQNASDKALDQNTIEFLSKLKEEESIILVSASSSKKILKRQGLDPQFIIVCGGPLICEDYKQINPHLSEQALLGIQKKCQNTLKLLQSNKVQKKELFFIYEPQNLTDKIILNELKSKISLIGKQVKPITISSWKKLEENSDL